MIRAWRSADYDQQQRWAVFWGVAWTVLNIGVVVFILAIAGQ